MSLFDLLFTTNIPDSMRFRGFTPPYFLLLIIVALAIFFAARHMKSLPAERRGKWLRIVTWSLPCMYLSRFLVFALLDHFVEPQMSLLDRLPFHLCATNAIVMPLAVTTRNKTLLNYMYAIAMPAAAAAMLTPAMSYYGQYAYFSWQVLFFYIDHGLMVMTAALCVAGGFVRPSIKEAPKIMGAFVAYCAVMYPVNRLLGQNYLFLNYPDEGTVMAFFAQYLGNPGYLAPMAVLFAAVVGLMYLPWVLRERRKTGRDATSSVPE